jgi:hypothetical protein
MLVAGLTVWKPEPASANHPVLVEGEKDYDGDGLVDTAEDTDNATDRIFGTINRGLDKIDFGPPSTRRMPTRTAGSSLSLPAASRKRQHYRRQRQRFARSRS